MYRPSQRQLRAVFVSLLLISLAPTVGAFTGQSDQQLPRLSESQIREQSVAPRDGITVVTTDAFGDGRVTAFARNGSVIYYNTTYSLYHDIDQNIGGSATVLYVATRFPSGECSPLETDARCAKMVIERLNVSTGEVARLYSEIRPTTTKLGVHDVDMVNETHVVVADIGYPDRVYMLDLETEMVEWSWRVQSDYSVVRGGRYPKDWTHMNDVEYLPDGRVMASLRNQDQVVFIDPATGLQPNWTLGNDDRHATLFEQHNPDYIPASRGGPAVVVADSENSRVVEYQRRNGSWIRSWVWRDAVMQWPRDADRLPNGNTLIADTNADRVIEVAPSGEIVWSIGYPGPYDVERLNTGAESTDGESAIAADLASRGGDIEVEDPRDIDDGDKIGLVTTVVLTVKNMIPSHIVNGILFLLPRWMTPAAVLAIAFQLGLLVLWAGLELYWSPYVIDVTVSKSW